VTAHQWWWEYEYPDEGVVAANELHIPIGRPVYLELKSVDVIHSFWVPKLAGKQDVVPGRSNFMTLRATRPDTYFGQCAEFCGLSHANMRLLVVSESEENFEEWIAEQKQPAGKPTNTLALQGEKLFQEGQCAGCHTIDGTNAQGKVGPNLTHLFARQRFAGAIFDLNRENLVRWLRDPPAMKPMLPDKGLGMPNLNLSEEEIEALVAYLETLE
ncbi:MAG: cytochrome c oxidase subunit II, partial [Acidimicrobiia bacterium]